MDIVAGEQALGSERRVVVVVSCREIDHRHIHVGRELVNVGAQGRDFRGIAGAGKGLRNDDDGIGAVSAELLHHQGYVGGCLRGGKITLQDVVDAEIDEGKVCTESRGTGDLAGTRRDAVTYDA